MADYASGDTHFSVREAVQAKATYQVLSSTKLLSGNTTSIAYDTRRYKDCVVYTNISQLSGTAGCLLNIQLQGSLYNDGNWFTLASAATLGTTGTYNQKLPVSAYLANWTRFRINSLASNDGRVWTTVDLNFVR